MQRHHRKCRITILMLRDVPLHTTIVALLIDRINSGVQGIYEPFIVRVDHNPAIIKDFIHQAIFKQKTDIIITVGELCATTARMVINDMVIGKPVLFLDVRDPLGLELVSSVERPGESFTGVVREDLPALVIAHYYSFFIPFLDTVLIPYTENDIYLLAKANDIKKCLNARNIKTHLIALPANSNGIESALQGYTDKVQGLILFDSCFIHALQEQFAYWCWKNEIIFFGTGPDVIAAGAACAVRNDYESLINAAYEQLRLFWEYKTPVSEIPVKVLNAEEEFLINIDILLRIGMPHELIKQVVLQPGVCAERTWTRLPKAFE
jgi:ABC-type uncharacterized transport system substrate-binding protein